MGLNVRMLAGLILLFSLPNVFGADKPDQDLGLFISAENPVQKTGAFCTVGLGVHDYTAEHPYVVQMGDVLEYDLLLSSNAPFTGGGVDLGFLGVGKLRNLISRLKPSLAAKNTRLMAGSIGRWSRIQVPLDLVVGREIGSWTFQIEGEKPGLYQAALDNIRISNGGRAKFSFFVNQDRMEFHTEKVNGFRSAALSVFKRNLLSDGTGLQSRMDRVYYTGLARHRMEAIKLGVLLLKDHYERTGKPENYPDLLEKAMAYGETKALTETKPDAFNAQLDKALVILEPLRPFAKQYSIHAVSYAHLDFIWQWSWAETLRTATQDFRQVLKFMDEFPEFTFSYTAPSLFEALQTQNPALFAEIQKRAKEGRWEMAGSRWCEADLNLISEESHARQFLHAHRFNREKFGVETTVCFEPDIFGHLWTFPQMLRKSGVKYYLSRQMNVSPPVFWWEGLDGSRILSYHLHHYMDNLDEGILDFSITKPQRALGYTDALVVYGVGNHGGGPSYDQIKNGLALDKLALYPSVKFSTLQGFMGKIASEPSTARVPVISREINHIFRGTYTTHAETKRLNRSCENLLATAESFAAIAQTIGIGPNAGRFDTAWRSLLWAHHHDTICGSTIHSSDLFAQETLRNIEKDVSSDLFQTLSNFSNAVKTSGAHENPRIVFNPVAWPTTAPVQLSLPDTTNHWEWIDANGRASPVQTQSNTQNVPSGVVVLQSLPALGYRTGWLRPSRKGPTDSLRAYPETNLPAWIVPLDKGDHRGSPLRSDLPKPTPSFSPPWQGGDGGGQEERRQDRVSGHALKRSGALTARNQHLLVEISPTSGNIIHLTQLAPKKEWISLKTESARFRIDHEAPHAMSAWEIGPIEKTEWLDKADRVECVEEGPVRIVFRAFYKWGQSILEKDIILYRDLSRLDFELRVDWQERGSSKVSAPMLRIEFPCAMNSARAVHLIPFGEIERPQDGVDYAASYGMGLSGREGSVCLLNNSKNGYSCANNTIRLTLLRSSYFPDPTPDVGRHTIPLALEISSKDWSGAAMARRGMEFNRRPIAINAAPHAGKFAPERGFLSIEPQTALLTALKTSHDSPTNLVMRIYQSANRPAKVRVETALPVRQWIETDLIERPLSGSSLGKNPLGMGDLLDLRSLSLKRWEIKTYQASSEK